VIFGHTSALGKLYSYATKKALLLCFRERGRRGAFEGHYMTTNVIARRACYDYSSTSSRVKVSRRPRSNHSRKAETA
jgi:hypothetical protein